MLATMNLLWFPLTLVCAFSAATSDALVKRALQAEHNEYLVVWLRLLLVAPVILAVYAVVPAPPPGAGFYRAALGALPLELVALFLYVRALKISPLSLTVPFLSLTPLFLLLVPAVMLGERVSIPGGIGVVLIAAGSYCLNLNSLKSGPLAPFRAIVRERGSLMMVGVALIYSMTSTLGKQAITASSPIVFAAFYFPLMAVAITPAVLWKGRGELKGAVRNGTLRVCLIPAGCYAVEIVTHMVAVSMTNVAYMIAVKRLSLLLGVLYGRFMFGEKSLGERLFGGTLMVAGVALIACGGT